ncbi:MAG: polysaccharide biosynthesis tyrosine autokinase [Bacteroidota bacterium]|nr:polysaccharide biosynthesis tyrosine autokinase [Bacteroidota bacterium]MDP4195490.1 polysaccharide biosynthesis tyrosine autokinase [Bacteroidota bacterium]
MENSKFVRKEAETNSFKDYLNLVRNNIIPIVLITLTGLLVSIIYAIKAPNIYKSTTILKVSKPQGSILNSPLIPDMQDFGSDRFVANEIEILKSLMVREKVAKSLTDEYNKSSYKKGFYLILNKDYGKDPEVTSPIKKESSICEVLGKSVSIEQKRGLDIVEITIESPSPAEAALIVNLYAQAYRNINLQISREQLTTVKDFLFEQRKEMQESLRKAEETLKSYQQAGGIVALDEQAKALIDQLSKFDADKNAAKIDLIVSNKNLAHYKDELKKQDPKLADYLESFVTEPYLKALQEQIAKLEIQKAVALADKETVVSKNVIADYDSKIKTLKDQVEQKKSVYKAGILASSPDEVKALTQKIIEEEIRNQSAKSTSQELSSMVGAYEKKFNSLPSATIEFARKERERAAIEKLYLLVEEKYQEAQINEQSQPGNVLIVDNARIPEKPSKPNRPLIVVIGFVLGLCMGVGFAFLRNYFDNTVKTPEDIEKKNINVLAWIPQIEGLGVNGNKDFEFIVAKKPDAIPSEAFRALRTRVQFSKFDKDAIRTLLVTSSAPQEGKTTVTTNLAGSFAQAGKKTIIIDCDLRKPRLHNVFKTNRYPGFTDYVFGQVTFDEIIRESEVNNLHYVTAGTIPPNPSEILGSSQLEDFIKKLKETYDIILLDSPPIIAVTDSEILSRLVDASMLVVSANTTELDLMEKSVELLTHERNTFIGVILNNFSYRSGYGSYYKYYYYYSRPNNGEKGSKKLTKV